MSKAISKSSLCLEVRRKDSTDYQRFKTVKEMNKAFTQLSKDKSVLAMYMRDDFDVIKRFRVDMKPKVKVILEVGSLETAPATAKKGGKKKNE